MNRLASPGGPIAWMARNAVAANLLMLAMLVGGFYVMVTTIKQEYLPNMDLDRVDISVVLPGATPGPAHSGPVAMISSISW